MSAVKQARAKWPRYPDHRRSEIDWLETVPSHWTASRLKWAIDRFVSGGTPDSDTETYWARDDEDGIYWIAIGDMTSSRQVAQTDRQITEEGRRSKRLEIVPPGTLIYSMYASVGEVAVTEVPAAFNQAILALMPNPQMAHQPFVKWWLTFLKPIVLRLCGTNTQDNLNAEKVGNIDLLVPPLAEQRAIAEFLDRETGRIDALIEKKRRLIELLEEKRTALITRAVTKGLDPDAPLKPSGVEWLGDIPEHWDMLPIKRLARPGIVGFVDGDWVESPYITDQGVRLIQTGNVGSGFYKEQGFRYVSEESFIELDCTEVQIGDILICRLADPVGRACLAPDLDCRMITAVDVAILKPREEHSTKFLVYGFSSQSYLDWLQAVCRGGTRDRVSRSMLGDIRIPIPPASEQRAIADELDDATQKLLMAGDAIEEAITKLQEYRTALISAAVTGKIDVRDM